jgi:Leucine Rich repeat
MAFVPFPPLFFVVRILFGRIIAMKQGHRQRLNVRPSRFGICVATAALFIAVAGCGKVPTYEELTEKKEPPVPQQPIERAVPANVAAVPQSAVPVEPEKPNAAEVIAWFQSLPSRQVNDQALARLMSLTEGLEAVTAINAVGGGVSDQGLADLHRLTALQSLALDKTNVTDEGMKHLARVPSLESLGLNGTRITASGLSTLASLPGLRRIELMECQLTPADFAAIGKLPALEILVLTNVLELLDPGLDMICEARTLKSLHLNGCAAITDA